MVNERDIGKTVITPNGVGKLWKIEGNWADIEMDSGYIMCFPLNEVKLPTIIGKEVRNERKGSDR